MPTARVDGINLFYEEVGEGAPLVFVHEFAGDYQSWHLQVRFFARRYRTIAYNARGYPPSDVPGDPAAYSQERAAEDIRGLLDALGIRRAHICGLSMGGYATLHFGLRHPDRALSLVVAGAGYGSVPGERERFRKDVEETARRFVDDGIVAVADFYTKGPTRVQLMDKDPKGWRELYDQFIAQSAEGHALTMRGVQMTRPSVYDLERDLERLEVPTLDRHRRRGRAVPGAGALPQAEDPVVRAAGASQVRPHREPRRAGSVQPRGAGLPHRRGRRALGAAQPRLAQPVGHPPPIKEPGNEPAARALHRDRPHPRALGPHLRAPARRHGRAGHSGSAREDVEGDFPRRGFDSQNLHRNKRSITLDLKAPKGVDILKRLIARADVVVENFRPDVKNRLGIDYETLAKDNPV